jgi:hypothetical protein
MAPIRNTMTRAVERQTCLFDKGMRLAKKISRLEIDKLTPIELVFLIIILIDIARLCGTRVLLLRENVGRGWCECFEHVLRSEVQAMRHASAEPPMSIHG